MWIWPSSRLRPPAATAPTSASKATGARPSTCARERVSRRPPSSAAPLPPARGDPSSLCKDPLFAGRAARRKEGPAPTAQAHGPAQPWGAGTAQGHGPLAQAQTPAGARAARRPLDTVHRIDEAAAGACAARRPGGRSGRPGARLGEAAQEAPDLQQLRAQRVAQRGREGGRERQAARRELRPLRLRLVRAALRVRAVPARAGAPPGHAALRARLATDRVRDRLG